MQLGGEAYAPGSVRDAISRGVLFIPEDMRGKGLVMSLSIAKNISLAALRSIASLGWVSLRKEHEVAAEMSERLDLNPRAPSREVRFLSGGNQRKALLGRAIFADGKLFVLEEPTQGVDVESQRQIHDHLRQLAGRGASVVFVSTDLEELIALGRPHHRDARGAHRPRVRARPASIPKSCSPPSKLPAAPSVN